ncbi:hypothetical protein BDN70DRAFT_990547 [Pholiota conissans]|uniref:Uncharacterized protein n=1 Tax=Pholiota conissans TaxID=109636 RepID=A0A9P6D533_9AGAR|nr:hypothetical protein BDN70DRAFT_990547 [Pholiota conissans]
MSLDDPNVIAGIAVDGQPFFSDPAAAHNQDAMSMDTPMPLKRPHSGLLQFPSALDSGEGGSAGASSMTSAAREADSRELREVWKQYMRTPLSGPTLDFGAPNMSPSRGGAQLGGNGSGGSGRRPRVASLPSSKTPVVERDHLYNHMAGGPGQMNGQEGAGGKAGTMSSLRTTLHGNEEDLRSYEAAVLARNPPTHLNLQVRRPAKGRGGGTGTSARPASAHETSGATIAHSASTSSLLNAFGNGGQQMGSAPPGRVSFVDIGKKEDSASPVPLSSRASSVSVDADGNNLSSDAESSRPSFKRLPSQTLGPANAKRAFLGYGDDEERVSGWGVTTDTNNAVSSDAGGNTGSIQKSNPGAGLGISQTDRIVASLAERRKRRMSAPSTNYIAPESNQTRRSQNQDQKQSQQGQGQTQGQSHQQKKEEIIPSVGYAPSGAQ